MSRLVHGVTPDVAALLRSPTVDRAMTYYEALRAKMGWPYPADATPEHTALAAVHKARLDWPGSTKAMVKESKAWLVAHGFAPQVGGPIPLGVQ